MIKIFLTAFFLLTSVAAFAVEEPTHPAFKHVKGHDVNRFSKEAPSVFDSKTPTPSRFFAADLSMPETFATTNNLAKKTGAFYRAFGEIIFIQGTLTDSFNVPIDGAVIEIWQKNSAGKYHTLLEPDSEFVDKYFSMSGRTVTDNLGNYHFITIMPGSVPGRAPHINMNVYHPKFGKLETEMYFEKHPYNETDYQYLSYSEDERKALTALVRHSDIMNTQSIKLCTFDLVLRGIHQYKHFKIMKSQRQLQIGENLKRVMCDIFMREDILTVPGSYITILQADVSPDAKNAYIYIDIFGNEPMHQKIIEKLNAMAPHFRYLMAKRITLRVVPEVTFVLDKTQAKAMSLEALIEEEGKKIKGIDVVNKKSKPSSRKKK